MVLCDAWCMVFSTNNIDTLFIRVQIAGYNIRRHMEAYKQMIDKIEKEIQRCIRETAIITLIGLVVIGFVGFMIGKEFRSGNYLWCITFIMLDVMNVTSLLNIRETSRRFIETSEGVLLRIHEEMRGNNANG